MSVRFAIEGDEVTMTAEPSPAEVAPPADDENFGIELA
jgi:hypothetical protein